MAETAVKLDEDVADVGDTGSAPAAPVEPVVAAQPAEDDYLQRALAEYDASIKQPPSQQPPVAPVQPSDDEIDKLLAELNAPSAAQQQQAAQLTALQSENAQLKGHLRYQADLADFEKLAGEVQSKLPAHVPEDYAAINFKAIAAERPEIALAFDLRHVDPRAANAEMLKVQHILGQLRRDPMADPNRVSALEQYGYRLNLARNSASILRAVKQEVIRRAERLRPPIDADATFDRELVAQSVRSAGGKAPVEPPPKLGELTNRQLNKWVRDQFGFDAV